MDLSQSALLLLTKDWFIPLFSIGLSICFAVSASRSATRATKTLASINAAVEGWQKQILASTVNILDSLPQVIDGRAALARFSAAQQLIEGIHTVITNPQGGASGYTQEQQLATLTLSLKDLLSSGQPK